MDFIFESVLNGMLTAWILGVFGLYNITEKVVNSIFKKVEFKTEYYYFMFIILSFVYNIFFKYPSGMISFKMLVN